MILHINIIFTKILDLVKCLMTASCLTWFDSTIKFLNLIFSLLDATLTTWLELDLIASQVKSSSLKSKRERLADTSKPDTGVNRARRLSVIDWVILHSTNALTSPANITSPPAKTYAIFRHNHREQTYPRPPSITFRPVFRAPIRSGRCARNANAVFCARRATARRPFRVGSAAASVCPRPRYQSSLMLGMVNKCWPHETAVLPLLIRVSSPAFILRCLRIFARAPRVNMHNDSYRNRTEIDRTNGNNT